MVITFSFTGRHPSYPKPANNSQSSDKCLVKFRLTGKSLAWSDTLTEHFCYSKKYFNWKFVAEYGTSYFYCYIHY